MLYNIYSRLFQLLVIWGILSSLVDARGKCPTSNRRVTYIDVYTESTTDLTDDIQRAVWAGFNVINIAYYISRYGASYDAAAIWETSMTSSQKTSILSYVHGYGGCILLSAGGDNDLAWNANSDGTAWGVTVGNYMLANSFDGIDLVFGSIPATFYYSSFDYLAWVIAATKSVRSTIGDSYVLTHGATPEYFGQVNGSDWAGTSGGYIAVEQQCTVDWYNVMYYNQGAYCFLTYYSMFNDSYIPAECSFTNSAVNQVIANGIPANKMVIGKPILGNYATGGGFVDATTLGTWMTLANLSQYGGYMGFQWTASDAWNWPYEISNFSWPASTSTTNSALAISTFHIASLLITSILATICALI